MGFFEKFLSRVSEILLVRGILCVENGWKAGRLVRSFCSNLGRTLWWFGLG